MNFNSGETNTSGTSLKKILLIEDDYSLGESLKTRLSQDYSVVVHRTFQEGLQEIQRDLPYDLYILDVGLPDGNGFDLGAKIKERKQTVPIIFLTAQFNAESRLRGFELGADEYIPKPFHLKELLLRIQHVLSSHSTMAPEPTREEFLLGDSIVSFHKLSITLPNGEIIYPPVTDLKVLKLLIDKSPHPLSRDQIIDQIWGVDENVSHRTVDNIIVRLRQLLAPFAPDKDWIRSVRGIGYQWSREWSRERSRERSREDSSKKHRR